ncbi:MAG: TrmB family transcriptional regulator [Acidimicrobiales bacterium]
MAEGQVERGESVRGDAAVGPLVQDLAREFEELGLSPSEARVTLALLQLGTAKSTQLAKVAAVPRTSIYQVIEALQDKGIVLRVPGEGPALWASPGRDKIFDRLHTALTAAQEARLEQHRARAARLRDKLAESVPEAPLVPLPFVHLLTCPQEVRQHHERLLAQAEFEVLVFNRPPYSTVARTTNAAAMRMLARGVTMRVLYQAAQVEDPEADAFRASVELYQEAGVEGRVVDELPIKLLVVDRQVALLAIDDPTVHDSGFPVTMLVEQSGFANAQAAAFEHYWLSGRPLPRVGARLSEGTQTS